MNKHFYGKYLFLKTTGELIAIDNTDGAYFNATDKDFNAFVHKAIDCDCYECVYFAPLRKYNIVTLVDGSGLFKLKPLNPYAWRLYSNMNWQAPIVGDVLFCGLCYEDFGEGFPERDLCALNHVQMNILKLMLGMKE